MSRNSILRNVGHRHVKDGSLTQRVIVNISRSFLQSCKAFSSQILFITKNETILSITLVIKTKENNKQHFNHTKENNR